MGAEQTTRRHVWVRGRVQQVWFRQTCRCRATERGVAGWVRNLADGRVEAVFEGTPAAVFEMVEWCRSGPRRAVVSDVQVIEEAPAGETGFHVA